MPTPQSKRLVKSRKANIQSKRPHLKSRLGCETCKLRRVKCDETKPICNNCIRNGRNCDFYESQIRSRRHQGVVTRSDFCKHFWKKTAFCISRYQISSARFWTELIPQLDVSYEPIYEMLQAFAVYQESAACGANSSALQSVEMYSQAVAHYSEASKQDALAKSNRIPLDITLITCLMFAYFENFQNSARNICMHARADLVLLQQYRNSPQLSQSTEALFRPIFEHVMIQSCAYHDGFPGVDDSIGEHYQLDTQLHVPLFFLKIYEAYECMDGLLTCISCCTWHQMSPQRRDVLERAKILLPSFLSALENSQQLSKSGQDSDTDMGQRCLQIDYLVAQIMADTELSNGQMVYDAHCLTFWHIMELADKLSVELKRKSLFILHLGFIPPLFFVATRCRDRVIRQRAVKLLHKSLHRERTWDSCTAARIDQRAISIEENEDSIMTGYYHRLHILPNIESNHNN